MNPIDLRECSRNILLKSFSDIRNQYKNTRFILVLDDAIVPIISSIFDMTELMEHNIVLCERYVLVRRPLQHYHAIYLLGPSVDIQPFIDDWKSDPKYSAPHVLFTYEPDESVLSKLHQSPSVVDHILTFKNLYIHFRPFDPMTFLLDLPCVFNSLYSTGPKYTLGKANQFMLQSLVSFFFAAKLRPVVAYDKTSSACQGFAAQFESKMTDLMRELQEKNLSKDFQGNTLLIILHRGDDAVAPLLHQFTFEAMVYEYYDVKDEIYTIDPKNKDDFLSLDYYYDQSYKDIRYVHMSSLMNTVKARSEEYRALHNLSINGTLDEKREAQRKITRVRKNYNQTISEFSVALELTQDKVTELVMESAAFEQNMVSGMKNETEAFKLQKIDLSSFLKKSLSPVDKMRLIAIYTMITKPMGESEVQRTLQSAGLPDDYWNTTMNASLVKGKVKRHNKYDKTRYTTDKYVPYVSEIAQNAVAKKLPADDFELPESSGRYQNIVIYVMGGISCMELREIDEIRNKNRGSRIYVGSTQLLTPQIYLDQIAELRDNPHNS